MKTIKFNSILLILTLCVGVALLFTTITDQKEEEGSKEMTHNKHLPMVPTMPGQEAFGTIQEIIEILESDPSTDWKSVNIDALRAHLIDMDEVTMNSNVKREDIANGLKMVVTGEGRTIDSIKRMVPTHNAMTLSSFDKWQTNVEIIDNGAMLTVTSNDKGEVDKIRGLGFIGIMSVSSNHQPHHLMMSKGMAHMLK